MVTPDKDFAQLVSENIFMYKPARMGNGIEIWGVKEVQEKFEVSDPLQVIDFLGMMGDSADNIPGLPGVGEKTAKKFIAEYGTMENLLANTDQIKGKLKEKIEQNKDKGILSKKLATIILDVPVEYDFKNFQLGEPDSDKIKELFDELEFLRMKENFFKIFSKKDIELEVASKKEEIQYDLFNSPGEINIDLSNKFTDFANSNHFYQHIETKLSSKLLFEKLDKQTEISFNILNHDIENNSFGICLAWQSQKSYFITILKKDKKTIERIKSIFQNNNIIKIGYDLKNQFKILNTYGIISEGPCFDSKIAHYLINPDIGHDFNILCKNYLNYKINDDLNTDIQRGMEKSDLTFQLKKLLINDLKKANLLTLFEKIEMPLLTVLSIMEINGIKVDSIFLKKLSNEFHDDLKLIEKRIFNLTNSNFNLASPKQLGEILFDKLKITDSPKKTKSGQYSTSEEVLSKLAKDHQVVREVLEWRSLQKLINTYVDALPKQINSISNRIHAVFNQAVAATGRLSSNNPNLQNIPIRSKRGRLIRKAFVCEDSNYVMLSADYSQIELRVIASLSEDPNMISAFKNNEDIHSSTASKVFNIDISDVTSEQRSNAKTVNFGIIYGVSAFGLSNQTSLNRSESKDLIESYFNAYPTLKTYISNQINFARENGYVETVLSRRRYLRDINSRNPILRGAAERNAVNAPVQGSAADIIKIAMINIQKIITSSKLKSRMLVQVHDELIFEIHKSELEKMKNIVKDEMENAFSLNVPLAVDVGVGENWFEAH